MAQTKRFYTQQELSELLGIPLSSVRHWRARGAGPIAHKFGRSIRYAVEDVDSWILEGRDRGTSAR